MSSRRRRRLKTGCAPQLGQVRRTELFDPDTNKWTVEYVDDASETPLPLFPRLTLMPNGQVLYNGSGQNFGPGGEDAGCSSAATPRWRRCTGTGGTRRPES